MSRLRPVQLAPLFTLLQLACGRPDSSGASAVSFDGTALVGRTHRAHGVSTVEFPADAFERAAKFVLDTVPVAVLTGRGSPNPSEWAFTRDVLFLADGGYAALLDTLAIRRVGRRLTWFDSVGTVIRTISVPNEIDHRDRLATLGGDTVVVRVAGSARFDYFTKEAGLVGGSRLLWTADLQGAPDTAHRSRQPIGLVVSDMAYNNPELIDSVPGDERAPIIVHFEDHDRASVVSVSFGQSPHIAAWKNVIAVARDSGYVIDQVDGEGRLIRHIHVAIPMRPVTPLMHDSMLDLLQRFEGLLEDVWTLPGPEAKTHRLALQPFADSLPAYSDIYASPNGTLGVLDLATFGDSVVYATAFRRDGAILGRLRFNRMVAPVSFGDDRVAVREIKRDQISALRVYRFRLAQ